MRTETWIKRCASLSRPQRKGIVAQHSCLALLAFLLGSLGLQAQSHGDIQRSGEIHIESPAKRAALASPRSNRTSVLITITQAIELAKKNNPLLRANVTLIQQSKAEEITANLRPNPVLTIDSQFLPLFTPSQSPSDYFNTAAQFDAGVGYVFERGGKRQRRLQAARDQTAITESQVADAERVLTENVAQEFVTVLFANSNLEFAIQSLNTYRQIVAASEEKHNWRPEQI